MPEYGFPREALPNNRLQLTGRGFCRAAALAGGRPRFARYQSGFAAGRRTVYGRRTAAGS
jgi:hypothetical protein